jgi:hypothetical protein
MEDLDRFLRAAMKEVEEAQERDDAIAMMLAWALWQGEHYSKQTALRLSYEQYENLVDEAHAFQLGIRKDGDTILAWVNIRQDTHEGHHHGVNKRLLRHDEY